MIYTDLTKKAMKLAFDVHRDQVDKGGIPYIYHPAHLAEMMDDEASVCTALLHDVLEDSCLTEDDLRRMGFPSYIVKSVSVLTRKADVPYMVYIQHIVDSDKTAAKVKMADLEHNLQDGRMGHLTEKDVQRIEKYRAALALLDGSAKK